MSGAASLPGAEFFPENRLLFEEATCPGQLRCLRQNFFSKNGLSGILALMSAEQDVENPNKWTFRNSETPVRRTKRRKYKRWTFRNYVTPVRRTRRRKSNKNYTFNNSGTLVRRTRCRKSQKMNCQELWDSCAQSRTSQI